MGAYGHYVRKSPHLLDGKYCLAAGSRRCSSRVEYVIGFVYTKKVHSQQGDRTIEVLTRKPACEWHAKRFAKKNKLHLPV